MSNWFEDWFGSEEYLTVYAHRDQAEAEKFLQLILNLTNLAVGSRILDLACGAGRHSIAFAKKGYAVTGIDLSESLLDVGKNEAANQGVNVDFQKQDIRSVQVDGTFDLVLNIFTSFGYFENDEENLGIFTTAYRYLREGGCFVFDFLNESFVKNTMVPFSQEERAGCIIRQFRSIDNGVVVKKIELQKGEEKHTFFERVKLYNDDILIDALQKTGFAIVSLCGDYGGGRFDKETSSRLIVVCKK